MGSGEAMVLRRLVTSVFTVHANWREAAEMFRVLAGVLARWRSVDVAAMCASAGSSSCRQRFRCSHTLGGGTGVQTLLRQMENHRAICDLKDSAMVAFSVLPGLRALPRMGVLERPSLPIS